MILVLFLVLAFIDESYKIFILFVNEQEEAI
jgi:hypothetical protein